MTINLKLKQGGWDKMTKKNKKGQVAEEYWEKLKLGLIEKPKSVDPIEKAKQNPKSLRMAINAKCFDCCCFKKSEVRFCTAVNCPLHKLRPWQPRQ